MTVFDAFQQSTYAYLIVSRGEVYGNRILEEKDYQGVFKLRAGSISTNNQESRQSSATMHIHPEDLAENDEIVGNGIRYADKDYEITGVTAGRNFDTNEIEHYTLTLERTEYVGES